MKAITMRNIRICSYATLTFCSIWLLLIVPHFVFLLGDKNIDWSINRLWKTGLIVMYMVSAVASVFLCLKIVLNVFKGLRENTAFPKNNIGLLFWFALVFFIYLLCRANEQAFYDEVMFKLLPDTFLIPFFILFFAFMYKVAADAVEENNLTI